MLTQCSPFVIIRCVYTHLYLCIFLYVGLPVRLCVCVWLLRRVAYRSSVRPVRRLWSAGDVDLWSLRFQWSIHSISPHWRHLGKDRRNHCHDLHSDCGKETHTLTLWSHAESTHRLTHTCTGICKHTHTYTGIRTHTHTYKRIRTHTHRPVHTCIHSYCTHRLIAYT